MTNSEITLEVCSNFEWLRVYGGADLADDDQAAQFNDNLYGKLADLGYQVEWAKGQRSLCHGWNGANTFRHKLGAVGTFDYLSAEQITEIHAAIDSAAVCATSKTT